MDTMETMDKTKENDLPILRRLQLQWQFEVSFKMEILDDGKLSEAKMLVELRIFDYDGDNIYVDWNHVYIKPVHETKTVILKSKVCSFTTTLFIMI